MLEDPLFRAEFEHLHEEISGSPAVRARGEEGNPPVHLLGLDPDFAGFVRLSLGVKKMPLDEALRLKGRVDRMLDTFRRSIPLLS